MKWLLCFSLAFALPGCAVWSRIFPESPRSGMLASGIKLPGSYGKAAGIALADFFAGEQDTLDELLGSPSPDDAKWQADVAFARCWLQPEAYDLYVDFDSARAVFTVLIFPVPEICLGKQGFAMRGGGATYAIDARTYEIVDRKPME